jgi:hypothetical protein
MASQNVDKILQAVQALNDAERSELINQVGTRVAQQPELTKQQRLRQQLVAESLLSHIPPKGKDIERFRRWEPIPIKGKPLSETIIERRR